MEKIGRFVAIGLVTCLLTGLNAQARSYTVSSLFEITERTDVWVRGDLVSVEFRPLKEKERYRFGHVGDVEVVARMRVTASVPALDESEITIHWATLKDFKLRIIPNRAYIAALNRRDDSTYGGPSALGLSGWFQSDPDSSGIGENISPDLVWQIVSELRHGLDNPARLDASASERWLARLQTGDLHEYGAAVLMFDAFPTLTLDPGTLLTAFERHYADAQARMEALRQPYPERRRFARVVLPTFTLLQRIADKDVTRRIIDLFMRDLSIGNSIFRHTDVSEPLVRMIAQHGGDTRCDMLKGLLKRKEVWNAEKSVLRIFAEYPGEDIDAMLLDMLNNPGEYGIPSTLALAGLWGGLVNRGLPEIYAYLDAFLAQAESFDLGVPYEKSREQTLIFARECMESYARRMPHARELKVLVQLYQQGDRTALKRILFIMTEEDDNLIPLLNAIPLGLFEDRSMGIAFSSGIARAFPIPAFIPQLRKIMNIQPNGFVLAALDACGDGEYVRKLAKAELGKPLPRGSWREVYDLINNKHSIIASLGKLDNPGLAPLIEPFTQAKLLDGYRKKLTSAARAEGKEPHDYAVGGVEKVAIMALARCSGATAIPRLREIYGDGDIAARIVAAVSLYALGDGTGLKLVRLFRENRELEDLEIRARWRIDLIDVFPATVQYLQNPRTDALLLERQKRQSSVNAHEVTANP
jgi:hypothetical protein